MFGLKRIGIFLLKSRILISMNCVLTGLKVMIRNSLKVFSGDLGEYE